MNAHSAHQVIIENEDVKESIKQKVYAITGGARPAPKYKNVETKWLW
ncbi:MAG TPA: hypothetical protein VGB84_01140 [Arachidicoccus sp.]